VSRNNFSARLKSVLPFFVENELPKRNRKWPRLILEGIVVAIVLVVALYVAGVVVFAIWHLLEIILRLFGLAPGGH
jgi:hypothetical protein